MSATRMSAKRQSTKKQRLSRLQIQLKNMYSCVIAEKCSKEGFFRYSLLNNPVSTPIPPHTSYHTQIEIVAAAASTPIAIESLPHELSERGRSPKGNSAFGNVADFIDRVASNCDLRWWITERGLAMAHLEPSSNLSEFDLVAGKLMQQYFQNGRLTQTDLTIIAKALDEQGFLLTEHVQPSYWKQIDTRNKLYPAKAVRNFSKAIESRPIGRRAVQRGLYAAYARFIKANGQR